MQKFDNNLDQDEIRNRVLGEAKAQGITMSALARMAEFSPSRLRMWKSRGGEIGHLGFGRILRVLGKSPSWAYGDEISESATAKTQDAKVATLLNEALRLAKTGVANAPSVEELLDWYHNHGGRVEDAGRLAVYFDIFGEPEPIGGLSPIRIGRKTMAAQAVPDRLPDSFNNLFARQPDDFRQEATKTQMLALEGCKLIERRDVEVGAIGGGSRRFVYNRVCLPGTFGGRRVVVNATLPVAALG